MIGFTIGTGPFRELAERAAETFRQTTGLPCVVIGDDEYKGSGLRYPHHLKYHMFDLVDSETVFYFDADLWWMREWNYRSMLEASDGKLIVVRDLLKSGHILKDARDFEIDVSVYFNSGFMVLHRDTHECMLKAAKGIYAREILSPMYLSNSKFKDQTSMNIARQILELPVHFIDRRYNWVQSAGEWIEKGVPVIGAHKIVRDTPGSSIINDFNTVLDKPLPDVKYEVIESAFEELSGAYRYSREGSDDRYIHLLPDGTIPDAGTLEQWWFPVIEQGVHKILVTGHTQPSWREYFTFEVSCIGAGKWSGRWNHFEEMPVELNRVEGIEHG